MYEATLKFNRKRVKYADRHEFMRGRQYIEEPKDDMSFWPFVQDGVVTMWTCPTPVGPRGAEVHLKTAIKWRSATRPTWFEIEADVGFREFIPFKCAVSQI